MSEAGSSGRDHSLTAKIPQSLRAGPLPATARGLGAAGLVPFVMAPLFLMLDGARAPAYVDAVALYALAIVCFLAGNWWGLALIRRHTAVLLVSNVVVVSAWAGLVVLGAKAALPLLAGLMAATVAFERLHPLFAPQPRYYARMRLALTVLAAGALLLTWALARA